MENVSTKEALFSPVTIILTIVSNLIVMFSSYE
jgi:hypothetical protein